MDAPTDIDELDWMLEMEREHGEEEREEVYYRGPGGRFFPHGGAEEPFTEDQGTEADAGAAPHDLDGPAGPELGGSGDPSSDQQGWTGQKKARLVVGEDAPEDAEPEQASRSGPRRRGTSAAGASGFGALGSEGATQRSSAQQRGKQPMAEEAHAWAQEEAWAEGGKSRPMDGEGSSGRQGTHEAGSSSSFHPGSSTPAGAFAQDRPQESAEEKRPRKIASDIPGDIVTVTVSSGRRVYCPVTAPQDGRAYGNVSWRSRSHAPGNGAGATLLGEGIDSLMDRVDNIRLRRALRASGLGESPQAGKPAGVETGDKAAASQEGGAEEPPAREGSSGANGAPEPPAPAQDMLWVDKYSPQSFTELLSDERTNRAVLSWLKQWDPLVFGATKASTSANVLSALRNHPMSASSGGGRAHAGAGRGTWRGAGGGRGGGGWHGGGGGRSSSGGGRGGGGWHGGSKPSYGSSNRSSGSYNSGGGGSYGSGSKPGYAGGDRSGGGGGRWSSSDSRGVQAKSFSGPGLSGRGAFAPEAGAAGRRRTPLAKVLLLCGAPGLGKTTLAHVAAKHCGYHVVEVNASDDRVASALRSRIQDAVQMTSVLASNSRPNCLVIDEIDGSLGSEGKGAVDALVEIIQADAKTARGRAAREEAGGRGGGAGGDGESDSEEERGGGGAGGREEGGGEAEGENGVDMRGGKRKRKRRSQRKGGGAGIKQLLRPIICIANDLYAPALRSLRQVAEVQVFQAPVVSRVVARLKHVCQGEGMAADVRTLTLLASLAECDVRACLNTLQFLHKSGRRAVGALGAGAGMEGDVETQILMGRKDMTRSMFDVWAQVFQNKDQSKTAGGVSMPSSAGRQASGAPPEKGGKEKGKDAAAAAAALRNEGFAGAGFASGGSGGPGAPGGGRRTSGDAGSGFGQLDRMLLHVGDHETVLHGIHENLMSSSRADLGLRRTTGACDWLAVADVWATRAVSKQQFGLLAYQSAAVAGVKLHMAGPERQRLEWPKLHHRLRTERAARVEVVHSWRHTVRMPEAWALASALLAGAGADILLDSVSPLLSLLAARSVRPLAPNLHTAKEKEALEGAVALMVPLGLSLLMPPPGTFSHHASSPFLALPSGGPSMPGALLGGAPAGGVPGASPHAAAAAAAAKGIAWGLSSAPTPGQGSAFVAGPGSAPGAALPGGAPGAPFAVAAGDMLVLSPPLHLLVQFGTGEVFRKVGIFLSSPTAKIVRHEVELAIIRRDAAHRQLKAGPKQSTPGALPHTLRPHTAPVPAATSREPPTVTPREPPTVPPSATATVPESVTATDTEAGASAVTAANAGADAASGIVENGAGSGSAGVVDASVGAAADGSTDGTAQEKGGIKTEAAVPWWKMGARAARKSSKVLKPGTVKAGPPT